MVSEAGTAPRLRTDARRNVDRIRAAAVEVFRAQGLSASLETVAAAAQVSKATIFNRFGGRIGLIDAVVDEVVAAELLDVIESTRSVPDPFERITDYVCALRDLQYRIPAVNDVLLQEFPDSKQLMALCHRGEAIHAELIEDGRAAGVLARDVTPEDLHALTIDTALVLKHGGRPPREDYDRRTAFVLRGLCGSPPSPDRHRHAP